MPTSTAIPFVRRPRMLALVALLVALLVVPGIVVARAPAALAQNSGTNRCPIPIPATKPQANVTAAALPTPAPASGKLLKVTMGYVPVSIFAPVFVAKEKGYYAAQGLDVSLEPLAGGADMVTLTATGKFDVGIGGVGPAFWNAMQQGLPLKVIAPGHAEGNPVATPLMISKAACESGKITKISDLKGKKVAVNAPGATEYWLDQALRTGGLTINDIDLQTLAFPNAVAALKSGAIAASMVGEPLATQAEQEGIALRLATDFPVQDIQPTVIFANSNWLKAHPAAATGLVTAYLHACRDLTGAGYKNPTNLAIIQKYTGVPASLVAQAVQPVYAVNGQINVAGLNKLQAFFRTRGQLTYKQNLDPNTFIDDQYVKAA